MPAALGAQDRQRRLGDVDHAQEIGRDLRLEIGQLDVLERGGVGVARVVDDDVEAAEVRVAGLDGGGDGGGVRDVQGEGEEAVRAEFGSQGGEGGDGAGGGDDAGA